MYNGKKGVYFVRFYLAIRPEVLHSNSHSHTFTHWWWLSSQNLQDQCGVQCLGQGYFNMGEQNKCPKPFVKYIAFNQIKAIIRVSFKNNNCIQVNKKNCFVCAARDGGRARTKIHMLQFHVRKQTIGLASKGTLKPPGKLALTFLINWRDQSKKN